MIVLGIDQAARSGWALATMSRAQAVPVVLAHGIATTHTHRVQVMAEVLTRVCVERDLLVVFEDHSTIPIGNKARFAGGVAPTRNVGVFLGMGEAKGEWNEQLCLHGVPQTHRTRVEPRVWRRAILGSASGDTLSLKALAVRWATAFTRSPVTDDNEAEAIAIAVWGAREGVALWERERAEHRSEARGKRNAKKQGSLGL